MKQELLTTLEKLLADKNNYQLEQKAKEAQEQFPDEAFGYYYQAEVQINYWSFKDAVDLLNKALSIDPNNFLYKERLAHATLKSTTEQGIEMYQQLMEDYPDRVEAPMALGQHYKSQWKNEEAIEYFDKVLEIRPNHIAAYLERGAARLSTHDFEGAFSDINHVLEEEPNNAKALESRIALYQSKGENEAAEADYLRLIEVDDQKHHRSNLGTFYKTTKQYEKAEATFSKVIEIEDAQGYTYNQSFLNRAEVRLMLKDYKGVIEDTNKAINLNPDANAYHLRADAKIGLEDNVGAMEDLEKALAKNTFNAWKTHKKIAALAIQMKQWEQAKQHFEIMTKDRWAEAEGYNGLGEVARLKGDLKTAHKHWSIASDKGSQEARKNIEQYCQELETAEDEAAQKALEEEFAGEKEKNAASPFLQQLFGKVWKADADKSFATDGPLTQVPEQIRTALMGLFTNLTVTITPETFTMTNPAMGGDIHAYYRIVETTEEGVKLYGKRADKDDPRTMDLRLEEEYLVIEGLSGNTEQEGPALYMKAATDEELIDDSEDALDRLKENAKNLFGTLFKAAAEKLQDLAENLEQPKGEGRSDSDSDNNQGDDK